MKKGFTLVELMLVVAVVAVLATVVIFTINPIEFLRQSRDAARVSSINTINKAASLYYSDAISSPSTLFMGSSSVVYVSIPDPTAPITGNQCQGLGLPALPTGWAYHCAASSTYLSTNGTGWIPINFGAYSAGSVISSIPTDPTNTTSTNLYYTYETDGIGGFKISAFLESQKDAPLMKTDGGNDPELYEKGTNLSLASGRGLIAYWPLDEGAGSIANDYSGNSSNAVFLSSPAWTAGHVGSGAIQISNAGSLSFQTPPSVLPTTSITVALWEDTNTSTFSNYIRYLNNQWTHFPGTWLLYTDSTGALYWGVAGPIATTQNVATCANLLVLNTWQFLVGTYDGTTLRTYINGSQCATRTFVGQTLYTGSYLDDTSGLFQMSDDIRIYNRALSAAEIQTMYNVEK